jgi:hypothetical protein
MSGQMTKLRHAYAASSRTTGHRFISTFIDGSTGSHHAIIPSLLELYKLSGVNPQAWYTDALTRVVNQ